LQSSGSVLGIAAGETAPPCTKWPLAPFAQVAFPPFGMRAKRARCRRSSWGLTQSGGHSGRSSADLEQTDGVSGAYHSPSQPHKRARPLTTIPSFTEAVAQSSEVGARKVYVFRAYKGLRPPRHVLLCASGSVEPAGSQVSFDGAPGSAGLSARLASRTRCALNARDRKRLQPNFGNG